MPNTAPSRADPVVVFPLGRWCPPQETSQPHPPPSGGRDPGDCGRGILAALTTGVGGELGFVPGTTAWNWGRRTVDGLPTVSGLKVLVEALAEPVDQSRVMSRHHVQATARPTEEGCMDAWGLASWVQVELTKPWYVGLSQGRHQMSEKGQEVATGPVSPSDVDKIRAPMLCLTDGTESPCTGCERHVRSRKLSYRSAGGGGWAKGVFHRARKELRPLRSHGRGFRHGTGRTQVDRRRLCHHDYTRQRTSSKGSGISWRGTWGMQGSWPPFSPSRGKFLDSVGPFILQRKDNKTDAGTPKNPRPP